MTQRLAQLNIAHMRAPIDDPLMEDFVAQLARINALADAAPGFVWRLQTTDGNTLGIGGFDDPMVLVNLSVWESIEALRAYAYETAHVEVLRQRQRWFERSEQAYQVLWWIPKGHTPTVAEARARLERLRATGPTPSAFTFAHSFLDP